MFIIIIIIIIIIQTVTCFKILNSITSVTPTNFFTLSGGSTRGHSLKLYCPGSRVIIRAHFFAVRIILVWNRLPPHVAAVDNVAPFVRDVNSLTTHFFMLALDGHSYCEFVIMFVAGCKDSI